VFIIWCQTDCLIEAASYGGLESLSYAYITINDMTVVSTTPSGNGGRGFNTVELSLSSCSATNVRHFDTYLSPANSENMANYINSLPLFTVLIGVTADDATYSLTQNLKSALLAIGVNVSGLKFRDQVSFVAQIGPEMMSVSKTAQNQTDSMKLMVTARGSMS
jgi:Interleukin-like EMT inducer